METMTKNSLIHQTGDVLHLFAVTDIICTLQSKNAGVIKSTVDELLAGCDVSSAVQFFLNRIGASSGWKTVQRHEKLEFGESPKSGVVAQM